MNKKPKILILVGGGEGPLKLFLRAGEKLGYKVTAASFNRLEFFTQDKDLSLKINGEDLADFDLIYFRLVGKRYEDAALVVEYAKEKGVILVDQIFAKESLIRLPLAKSLEARLFAKAGIPVPDTYFGSLKQIKTEGPKRFGFPFVIKGTTGKQGHAVWSPRNKKELEESVLKLRPEEKRGGRFIAQQFIQAGQRHRHLVVGDQVIGAITRPTRWRKRFLGKEAPAGKREAISPIPEKEKQLALKACRAIGIEIGGVDLLKEEQTGKLWVIEVNSAPRWASVRNDTGINVEEKIVEYLAKKAKNN